jgi:multidrug efflux pump subunit AcrA (membrane-fusion protein)
MIKFLNKVKAVLFKPLVLVGISIAVIVVIFVSYSNRGSGPNYETVTTKIGSVSEQVNVTGHVKPSEDVSLSFEKSGKIASVNVVVGSHVSLGQTLATLDANDVSAQLAQAKAEIDIQNVQIDGAKINLSGNANALADKIRDAYSKSDDAISTQVDQFFSNPTNFNADLKFIIPDNKLQKDVATSRISIWQMMVQWSSSLGNLSSNNDLGTYSQSAKSNLNQVKSFMDKASSALNALEASSYPTSTTINGWKANVSAARASIATASSTLIAAEDAWSAAASNLSLQQTKLISDVANVDNYKAQLAKTSITSPISGIITEVNIKPGEITTTNVPAFRIISDGKFEIRANVPEADITKIKLSADVDVTLDAYGDDVIFKAKIVAIDPAETVIEGVTTYKVTIQFVQNDERVKSGMTANIDIKGKVQANVIVIPQQTIINRDGDKIVKVLKTDKTVSEIKVEVGLRGYDGNIAVTSGLKEGDKVILFQK